MEVCRTSLAVQWLRFHAPNAADVGSVSGGGTRIQDAMWCSKNKNKKFLNKEWKIEKRKGNRRMAEMCRFMQF